MLQTTHLQALIIDDQPEMCNQLKNMLERLGLKKISIADSGLKAIELIGKNNYDIVLSDYELGSGKDGLQILEECKHREILKNTACFIMVTAIQTGEMVLGAIEHQPDAYVVKPITFDDLRLRLERTLNVKETYAEIYTAMDKKKYLDALMHCDQLIQERPKLRLPILKIKGKLLLLTEEYQKAEAMYAEVLSIRKLPWALFGMAKIYFVQNKLAEAERLLIQLIRMNNNFTMAYDLLSKIKEQNGDTQGAQNILQKAVAFSPRAIKRQSTLSRLAVTNKDWEAALDASRKGVELGRHSCFRTPENYVHLTAALQPQLNS